MDMFWIPKKANNENPRYKFYWVKDISFKQDCEIQSD